MVWFVLTLAHASGIDVPQVGSIFSGPTTVDATAVYWNAASVARLRRGAIQIDLGLDLADVGYTRERRGTYPFEDALVYADPVDEELIDPSKSGTSEPVRATALLPTGAIFGAGPVHDRVGFGMALTVPYAAPLAFPYDGPQRFALQEIVLLIPQLTAAVGVRAHDRVQAGASVSYLPGFTSFARSQDFAGIDLLGDALADPPINQPNDFGVDAPSTVREQRVLERPFRIPRAFAHGVSFQIGLAAQPLDQLELGLTYDHGARMAFRGPFQLDVDDPFFTDDLAAKGLSFPPLVEGDATLSFTLPARIGLGIGWIVRDNLRLDLEARYSRWSSVRSFDLELTSPALAQPALGLGDTTTASVPRRWFDTVALRLRSTVSPSSRLRLAVVLGYDSPASPDATMDVSSPDGHRLHGAIGVEPRLSDRLALTVDAAAQGIVPRTVTTSDHDLGNGRYTLLVAQIALHLRIALGPTTEPPR